MNENFDGGLNWVPEPEHDDTVKDSIRRERIRRRDFRKVEIIAKKFLFPEEQEILLSSLFDDPEDFGFFCGCRTRKEHVLKIIKLLCEFFIYSDYKKIGLRCQEIFSESQYKLIKTFIRCRTFTRMYRKYDCTIAALSQRFTTILKKMKKYPELEPLLRLLTGFRGEKNRIVHNQVDTFARRASLNKKNVFETSWKNIQSKWEKSLN